MPHALDTSEQRTAERSDVGIVEFLSLFTLWDVLMQHKYKALGARCVCGSWQLGKVGCLYLTNWEALK